LLNFLSRKSLKPFGGKLRQGSAAGKNGKVKDSSCPAGLAYFLLTAKETKLPARNYSYSLYIFNCIHEGYAVFLLKLVSRLGQCHPEKLTMPV